MSAKSKQQRFRFGMRHLACAALFVACLAWLVRLGSAGTLVALLLLPLLLVGLGAVPDASHRAARDGSGFAVYLAYLSYCAVVLLAWLGDTMPAK